MLNDLIPANLARTRNAGAFAQIPRATGRGLIANAGLETLFKQSHQLLQQHREFS